MLAVHRVNYIVLGPGDQAAQLLREVGCRLVCQRGAFSLWRCPESRSCRVP
jgi:hypothetical protein